ncbi:2-C-methyl-D-erythritol 4-phosphate cytidylyltransferase [bacterium]|nr:2-C-methyl-D-erythritol 4-phosphate cytidylyltransferase [bacterium]
MEKRVEVIIVAGGKGRRMGGPVPKAFLGLNGLPIFTYALKTFLAIEAVRRVILVVPPGEEEKAQAVCRELTLDKSYLVICGGARRQDSVRSGMDHLLEETEIVLVHDAARPFCTREIIQRVMIAVKKHGAAVPGIPLADTLKKVDGEAFVHGTVDRRSLVAVQTPQGFQRILLREAYQNAWKKNLTATDDAGLVELLGHRIAVVEGHAKNFKITKPYDLALAEILFKNTGSLSE